MTSARLRATRGLLLVAPLALALGIGSMFALAPHCDRAIGDETDFPLFVVTGEAVCGAGVLVDGSPLDVFD